VNYIDPYLKKYDLEKLKNDPFSQYYVPFLTISNLENKDNFLIVSEPGFGKTRLLKEFLIKSGEPGIFIDLKKIKDRNIEDYIKQIQDNLLEHSTFDNELEEAKEFKTKYFNLSNESKLIFCFDALDEVKSELFSDTIDNIKKFMRIYNVSKFVISCRKNYINKWRHLFVELKFVYLEILPLDIPKVNKFLRSIFTNDIEIDNLLERLNIHPKQSDIIVVPRYLIMLADCIKDGSIENIKNRNDLFEVFIYKKLDIEINKLNIPNKKEIVKRVLEKLALVMKIYQTNEITKDELMDFFDDVSSNLNTSFLNQIPLDVFYERSIIKDNIDSIEFENTEFLEYLASKEVIRLGHLDQVVYDLSVVAELTEFHPAWINTLSFVVDQDIKILKQIIEYTFNNDNNVHIEDTTKLLTKQNVNSLNETDRNAIFKMIFLYYQKNAQWMSIDLCDKLSYYYSISLNEFLETEYSKINNKSDSVTLINYLSILSNILENKFLVEVDHYKLKERLKSIIIENLSNPQIARKSVNALSKYDDINLYTNKIINLIKKTRNKDLITELVHCLCRINPNVQKSYHTLAIGLKYGDSIFLKYDLIKVTAKSAISNLLKHITENNELLDSLIEKEYNQDSYEEFINNIRNVVDSKNVDILKTLIDKVLAGDKWYRGQNSYFIKEIAKIINTISPNYVFELIRINPSNFKYHSMVNILTFLLEKKDVCKFIKEIKKHNQGSPWFALMVLRSIKWSDRNDREQIYEEGRKFLSKEYVEEEAKTLDFQKSEDIRKQKTYSDFKFKLEPAPRKYMSDVFTYYVENRKELESFITEKDRKRLETIMRKYVFKIYDPRNFKVVVNSRIAGSTSITTTNISRLFGDSILAAKLLNVNVEDYREKILSYIPHSYSDHLDAIASLVPNPTNEEFRSILDTYENRDDDLVYFMPYNTIKFCEEYKITESISLLREFVNSERISIHDRERALKAISILSNNEQIYFQNIFKKYLEVENNIKSLSYVANEILIYSYDDIDAIKWRFNKIVEKSFGFTEPEEGVGYYVGENENELRGKYFARPLMQLKDIKYKKSFLTLLDESIKINQQGEDYLGYTKYIWEIVVEYYKNLKEYKDYSLLSELEKFIEKNRKEKNINLFRYYLRDLKSEYLLYISKPSNISDCIKSYNFYKEIKYTPIATSMDLLGLVKYVIGKDMKNWIEVEGAYKYIEENRPKNKKNFRREDLIQKTINTQFENGLLKAGLRKDEIHIQRESQLLDDQRTDFLISYGFTGPILIELKLTTNTELHTKKSREAYKRKLINYVKGTNSKYGVFIIFQIYKTHPVEKYIPILKDLYKDTNIEIIGLNCTLSGK